MTKRRIRDFAADRMERLFHERLLGIEGQVSEHAITSKHQFRSLIPDKVHELRGLVPNLIMNLVPSPVPVEILPLRVFKNVARCPRQTRREDIVPTISVEVVDPGKKVVRVTPTVLWFRGIDLVPLKELGPFPPERPMDDVDFAILIDVTEVRPLREVLVGQLLTLKARHLVLVGNDCSK